MRIDEEKTFDIEAEVDGFFTIYATGTAYITGYQSPDTLDQPGDCEVNTRIEFDTLELWGKLSESVKATGLKVLEMDGAIAAISNELSRLDIDWNGN